MLTLQRLQLTNWCQHESLDKTFGPTTTGIIGQNGSGKSNMVAAIHYALRGTTLSNETLESCINFNADSAKVKLWFAIDDKPGTITRTLTKRRRRPTGSLQDHANWLRWHHHPSAQDCMTSC